MKKGVIGFVALMMLCLTASAVDGGGSVGSNSTKDDGWPGPVNGYPMLGLQGPESKKEVSQPMVTNPNGDQIVLITRANLKSFSVRPYPVCWVAEVHLNLQDGRSIDVEQARVKYPRVTECTDKDGVLSQMFYRVQSGMITENMGVCTKTVAILNLDLKSVNFDRPVVPCPKGK